MPCEKRCLPREKLKPYARFVIEDEGKDKVVEMVPTEGILDPCQQMEQVCLQRAGGDYDDELLQLRGQIHRLRGYVQRENMLNAKQLPLMHFFK